jgi:NADH-quinone oxidoreductase subunit N
MLAGDLIIISPEVILAIIAFASQLSGLFYNYKNTIVNITITASIILGFILFSISSIETMGFSNTFVVSKFTSMLKLLVLGFSIVSILIYQDFCKITARELKLEFITLILLSTLGIFISISSRNLLLLFCGLELQALAGYALAAFNSAHYKSSEAGLKYFVLGALLSCITLLGMSFLYGFGGSLDFSIIHKAFNANLNLGLIVGGVLLISGIFFKLSVAPMHTWTPDVYEGAPISAVTYFSTAQKIGVLAILINIIHFLIGDYIVLSETLIKLVAILSMLIGAFGAIRQQSLKRLMGYSTILNVGYALIGIALHSKEGMDAAILYMVIYIAGVAGFFASLVALLGDKADDANFDDINGVALNRKAIAGGISIIMFSMIGLPPFAGFFGKYYIFYQAVLEKEFTLAFIGILTTIIASYYYLKIIKAMYFIDRKVEIERIPTNTRLLLITSASVGFILFFSFIMQI